MGTHMHVNCTCGPPPLTLHRLSQQPEGGARPCECMRHQGGRLKLLQHPSKPLRTRALLQMALYGQEPTAIMETALEAIRFYNVQQQVLGNTR